MRCTTPYCRIRISRSKSYFLLPVMALLACGTAMAQLPTYKVGRPATEAEMRPWDAVVGSDGKELPPGSGSAKEGAALFAAQCSFCHGKDGQGGVIVPTSFGFTYSRLVGGVGTINSPTGIKTVGSYMPYATTIWDFINRAMPPFPLEKNLTPDNVYAAVAFILYKNGIIKETDVMDKNSLLEVQMPNRHGFYPDPPQEKPGKDGYWLPRWELAAKPAAK
ncbi:MAG: c-type cytochrome [Acidobacteriia bacterium]|nr:c-type cytochrome [Terriglobia bacterium]